MIPNIQRKFIRKHEHITPAVNVTTKMYEAGPPEDRYQRHVALWSFWCGELLDGLGQNRKKAERATGELISELEAMQSLLVPEKQARLTAYVARLQLLQRELVAGTLTMNASYRWRSEVEQQQRVVDNEFALKRIHEFLAPPAPSEPAAAAPAPSE